MHFLLCFVFLGTPKNRTLLLISEMNQELQVFRLIFFLGKKTQSNVNLVSEFRIGQQSLLLLF